MIQVSEQPHGAWTVSERVAVLAFEHVAAIVKHAPVESQPVRLSRLAGAAVTQRPGAHVKLVYHAPGAAARVCRITPRSVLHHSPSHELRAGIVGVAVV